MTTLTTSHLCDLAVEANLVPDAMFYGWDMYGGWQRDVCRHFGGPQDKVILDIGCGPLRFGAFVVEEIGSGHFYGVEPFGPYVRIARQIAEELDATDRTTIIQSETFEFPIDIEVDFGMCHAVFTHLSYEQITACLERVARVMKSGAPFIFTFNTNKQGRTIHRGRTYGEQLPLISVHLPDDSVFHDFCAGTGRTYRRFDDVSHPNQNCALITF